MQLSKILLPVDFSERCMEAAHYAKALACRFHSDLTMAHVFELSDAIETVPRTNDYLEWSRRRREETRRMLQDLYADEFRNIAVRRVLLEGDVAQAVVDLAHSDKMDLIVMPTHGYGRFRRFIIGSVTAKVLHDANCPVLTGVHLPEMPTLEPILFRTIVCAIDFDNAGERALRWAAEAAAEFHASLMLVHVLVPTPTGKASYDQRFPNDASADRGGEGSRTPEAVRYECRGDPRDRVGCQGGLQSDGCGGWGFGCSRPARRPWLDGAPAC